MVEGAEGDHDSDGLVASERQSVGRRGVEPHRHLVSVLSAQEFYTLVHAVDRTIHLDERVDERLSALPGGFDRQLLSALLHDGGGTPEDLDPAGRAEPSISVAEESVGRVQGPLHDRRSSALHGRDEGPIPGRMDVHEFAVRRSARNHEWELISHSCISGGAASESDR